MKNKILFILLVLYIIPTYANGDIDLSSEITKYFFKPIKLEKITGSFNGVYIVLPEDNIPYEKIDFLGNEEYPMRYYSYSMCMKDKKCNGSSISLFDQEFHLGTNNNTKDFYIDFYPDCTWWRLNVKDRSYICSIALLK